MLDQSPEKSSIFDFMYHDTRRVGAFLAQFETYGVPLSVKSNESAGRQSSRKMSGTIGGNAIGLIKGQTSLNIENTDDEREGAERAYDPLWVNARLLLDHLQSSGRLHTKLENAGLGSVVSFSGAISFADLTLIRKAWDLKTVKAAVGIGLAHSRKTRNIKNSEENALNQIFEMLSILPHSVQAQFSGADQVWCSLDESNLIGSASDVILKHGSEIPGEWHCLGILDARPSVEWIPPPDIQSDGTITSISTVFAGVTRQLLGRPDASYGVTPIMIFREVV